LGGGSRQEMCGCTRLLPPGLEVHDVVLEVPEPLDDLSPELEELAPAVMFANNCLEIGWSLAD
jgi:hypothetical protein